MQLPNYYLADLPAEATLNPSLIQEAAVAIKRNRAQYLETRSTSSLIATLAHVGEECLNTDSLLRRRMLSAGPEGTGFSKTTLSEGLDVFFRTLTRDALTDLVRQDLGHERRLDEFCSTTLDQRVRKASMACGPDLIAHVAAGNLPVSAMQSLVLGVLAKSAQFVKCASGASLLPRFFAHAIHEIDPKLGACIEIAEWPSARRELSGSLFSEAACVTASGSDESLTDIRSMIQVHKRFVGYGHRLSFAMVSKELMNAHNLSRVAARAAVDVTAWDQLGCLSPHVIYVEEGGAAAPEAFAESLAKELARIESADPRGAVSAETAAAITVRRNLFEIRASAGSGTRLWKSENSTAWTVVFDPESRFQTSCLHRFIFVKGVASLQDALEAADSVRGMVSTVGIAVSEGDAARWATAFARWGATRVCPLGNMQHPPTCWRHDGRPSLDDLVRWIDWEQ